MKDITKKCKFCNKEFKPTNKRQIYCDNVCRQKAYYRRNNPLEIFGLCFWCGETFTPKSNRELYCSEECARQSKNNKSKKLMYKLRREFPELYYNELGSKGTSINYKMYRDENNNPDFEKEESWVRREKRRLQKY
ncbi:hypothetical protein DSECCO2_359900 [anaerobic digester metagenome]